LVSLGSDPTNGMFVDGDVTTELSSDASLYSGLSLAYLLIGAAGFIIGSILSWAMKKWVSLARSLINKTYEFNNVIGGTNALSNI